jgi:hypothetical protein
MTPGLRALRLVIPAGCSHPAANGPAIACKVVPDPGKSFAMRIATARQAEMLPVRLVLKYERLPDFTFGAIQ